MREIDWKIGVEVELMAPPGASRQALAEAYAAARGGRVTRFFHPQSEPSKVPGQPVFHNLTLGFEARDAEGALIARCVDDLTLQDDLDRQRAPRDGWYRVVSDDERLLRLIARHADASLPLPEVLEAVAELFGSEVEACGGQLHRVRDPWGAPICIGAPLPGERERPCELITPPLDADHGARLEALLAPARALGFTAPAEGAVHVHFDATPLCSPRAIANLVELLHAHGPNLRRLARTNPRCRRLGGWPPTLLALVRAPSFVEGGWDAAREALAGLKLTKYCDHNLRNIAHHFTDRHTYEARIFPVWTHARPILDAAALIAAILHRACAPQPVAPVAAPLAWSPAAVAGLLDALPLDAGQRALWMSRAA